MSIERLETKDNGREIDVPGGMIHHWVGTAFVRVGDASTQALALLQDYNAHQRIYAPTVAASKLLSRDGDRFTILPPLRHEEGHHRRRQQRA